MTDAAGDAAGQDAIAEGVPPASEVAAYNGSRAPSALSEIPPTSPSLPPSSFAAGGDVVQGLAFNRTRAFIKHESMYPRSGGRPSNSTMPAKHLAPSLSMRNPSDLLPTNSDGAALFADSHITLPPPGMPPAAAGAVKSDDYLASLLPTSGFGAAAGGRFGGGAGEPHPGFASTSPEPAPAAPGRAPSTPGAGTPQPGAQPPTPAQLSEGGHVLPPQQPADVSGDISFPTVPQEDPSTHHKPSFMATYQFQSVTADGGVALAFDQLEGELDTAALEQLHNAIDALVEEQHEHPAVDKELEQAVAQELMVLNANLQELNSIDAQEKQLLHQLAQEQHEEQGEEDAAAAEPADDAPPTPTLTPQQAKPLAPEAAFVPNATPPRSSATSGAAAGLKDKLPPLRPQTPPERPSALAPSAAAAAAAAGKVASPASKADEALSRSKEQHSHLNATRPSSRLLQKLQSAKEQLTTTIQLGFQAGHFKRLNIVILVVGTRGDVQPFVGIGLKLKAFGHRVRLASHAVYREFVTGFGLEFYPLGGDPKVLSEFVVKHRGIMPGWDIKDALQQREQVREILYSTWGACTAPDPQRPDKPFRADAIVANPPSYGHTHCAEKLNVPLHVVFTMPWTPTKAFPQPFARIKTNMNGNNSKAREVMNWMSYFAMEDLAWLGMAGMQKDFRQRVLGLQGWNKYTTSHAIFHSQVPISYIWAKCLVPRPVDWPAHCEVVGFCSVELRKLTSYEPPAELKAFLDAGPPPVYIGFGSLVVDNPTQLTNQFLQAIERTGLRAIIQRGWGGLGGDYGKQPSGKEGKKAPPNVLFIDSAPHDWLFQCVCAVVHHGGAGTTATGLMAGKPTFIVPFFGDQPFWGAACERAGVGPAPVAIDDLTTDKIVDALKELILPTRLKAAQKLAKEMAQEDGIAAAVDHIHRTIYTTLLGRSMPIWMKPKTAPAVATTSIEQVEGAEEGGLRGMLALPTRIFGKGKSTVGQRGLAGELSAASAPNGAGMAGGFRTSPTNQPEVVGAQRRKGGFLSFLGC